jgi:hypothetical protein
MAHWLPTVLQPIAARGESGELTSRVAFRACVRAWPLQRSLQAPVAAGKPTFAICNGVVAGGVLKAWSSSG